MHNMRSYNDLLNEYTLLVERYNAIEELNQKRVFKVSYLVLALSIILVPYFIIGMGTNFGDTIAIFLFSMTGFFIGSCIVGNMIRNRFSDYRELDEKIKDLSYLMDMYPRLSVKETVAKTYGLKSIDSITLKFFDSNRLNEYWKANYFIQGKAKEVIVAYNRKSHISSIANSVPTI